MFGHHPRPGCYMSQPVLEGLFLGARLAVWALLGAVPMRDGGSAQTDHSPGDSGTNNGQQHPVTSTCLLLILLIKSNKPSPFPPTSLQRPVISVTTAP